MPGSLTTTPVRTSATIATVAAALLLAGTGLLLSGDALNIAWFQTVNGATPPGLRALASNLTLLGSGYVVVLLLLAADRGHGAGPALALRLLLIGGLLTRAGKMGLAEPRPLTALGPDAVQVIGMPVAAANAMPSGHTLAAFAGALALWWVWRTSAGPSSQRAQWGLLALLMAVAAGAGWSRIAVGAHWPSDVLAGAGCGLLVAALAIAWERRQPWAPWLARPAAQRAVALTEIVVALVWLTLSTDQPNTQWLHGVIGATGLASGALRAWRQWRPDRRAGA